MKKDQILIYTDFRKASYRNLIVCQELLGVLEKCEPSRYSHIVHKIYYLGGYIIEYTYKFALFSHLLPKENAKTNIYEYRKEDDFDKKWTVHDFNTLRTLCSSCKVKFNTDVPYFGNTKISKDFRMLLTSWNVQIRYSSNLTNTEEGAPKLDFRKINIQEFVYALRDIVDKFYSKSTDC